MKCAACQYDDVAHNQDIKMLPFIKVKVMRAPNVNEKGMWSYFDAFACPRCGTVRIEI